MAGREIDPEVLAAFLDGGLTEIERAAVVDRLAESGDDFETLVEAARVITDLEASDTVAGARSAAPVVVAARGEGRWRSLGRLLPIAAALAALLLIPVLRDGDRAGDVLALLRQNDVLRQGTPGLLAASWARVDWPAARGETQPNARAAAFRGAVHLVNLQLADEVGDADAVRINGNALIELLNTRPGGGPAAARITPLVAQGEAADPSERAAITREVSSVLDDSGWFALGVWIGQLRALSSTALDAPTLERAHAELAAIRTRLAQSEAAQTDASGQAAMREIEVLLDVLRTSQVDSVALAVDAVLRQAGAAN